MEMLSTFTLFVKLCFVLGQIVSNYSMSSGEDILIPDYKIELNLDNPRQSISSPGFPYEYYPPNTQIIYEIIIKLEDEVKQLSNRILLTFEMFSLQDSDFCAKDGLEVADVSDQIRVYCGAQVGRTILSEGSKLYIRFFSDSTTESRGYSILLEMYNTGCSSHFKDVATGSFMSPNFPGRYYADDVCVWKIDAPEGKKIRVDFDKTFDIRAYEPLCVQDYLAISLTGNFETNVKRYCHGTRPVSLYSAQNSLLFVFRTDCCFEGKGFRASFTVVDEDEVITPPPPEPLPQTCPCGEENSPESERILGGKTVDPPNRYPWVVALVKKLKNNKDDFYCGGALINKQYVLTAAHCIEKEKVTETRIAVGAHDTDSNAVTIPALQFILHPNYKNKVYFNDIALIKLQEAVDFTNEIRPICLPNSDMLTEEETNAVVAGWGQQSLETSNPDTALKEVEVPVVSNPKCAARYGGVVLDTNVCAGGERGKDACGGDSGGPLFTKNDGKWYALGIVSWGVSCGRERYPGVYTRVSKYLEWIQDNTKDAPPCNDEIAPPVQPNLDNCGIPNTDATNRIVGGVEATPFEYPWMVMIVYDKTVIGAGSLISPFYVLTSASTFDNVMEWYPELLDVYLGRHSIKKSSTTSKRYSVQMVLKHPQYGKPTPYNNDMALLKLETENGVPGLYKPICLPRSDAWYEDLSLTTAGWGSTSSSGEGSEVLRKVDLKVWNDADCSQRYPGWFTDTMICAYKQGADTCHGDKGAPLMRLYYGRYYLAGLSSWASNKGCAVRNAPRVFSAVHANLKWISDITGLEVM